MIYLSTKCTRIGELVAKLSHNGFLLHQCASISLLILYLLTWDNLNNLHYNSGLL